MPSVAKAATCSTCGGILSGYRQDELLGFPVYCCPTCEVRTREAVRIEAMPETDYLEDAYLEVAYPEAP